MTLPWKTMVGAALVAGATATAVTAALPTGAGAAASCTAEGTLPAVVTLTTHAVVVRPVLRGTAGCTPGRFDNGATATLRGPGGSTYDQRWARLNSAERIDLYPTLTKPGRYVLTDGNVQEYDSNEVRIPSSWRTTTMVVRFGSTFSSVSTSGGTVSAKLNRYGANGSYSPGNVAVSLERRVGSNWRTVAYVHTSASGWVHIRHGVNSSYRIVGVGSSTMSAAVHSLH